MVNAFGGGGVTRRQGDQGDFGSTKQRLLSQQQGTRLPVGDIAGQVLSGLPPTTVGGGSDATLLDAPTGDTINAAAGAPSSGRGSSSGVQTFRSGDPGVFREFTSHGPTGRTSLVDPMQSVDGIRNPAWAAQAAAGTLLSDIYTDGLIRDDAGNITGGAHSGIGKQRATDDRSPPRTPSDLGENVGLNSALRDRFNFQGDFSGGEFDAFRGQQGTGRQDDIADFILNFSGAGGGGGVAPPATTTPNVANAATGIQAPPSLSDFQNQNFYSQFATDPSNPGGAIQNALQGVDPAIAKYVLDTPRMNDVRRWDITGDNFGTAQQTANPVLQQLMFQQALAQYNNQSGGQ